MRLHARRKLFLDTESRASHTEHTRITQRSLSTTTAPRRARAPRRGLAGLAAKVMAEATCKPSVLSVLGYRNWPCLRGDEAPKATCRWLVNTPQGGNPTEHDEPQWRVTWNESALETPRIILDCALRAENGTRPCGDRTLYEEIRYPELGGPKSDS